MRENVSLDPVEHSVRGHDTHLQNHGKAKRLWKLTQLVGIKNEIHSFIQSYI